MSGRSFFLAAIGLLAGACAATRGQVEPLAPPASALPVAEQDATLAEESDDEPEPTDDAEDASRCPSEMALVEDRVCVDKWEASILEIAADGTETPHPHWLPVDGLVVRAVSEPAVFPQGYISETQADDACRASSKRLCGYEEWKTACMGPMRTTFPYGEARMPGVCHDLGKNAVAAVFGQSAMASASPPRMTAKASAKGKKGQKAAKAGAKTKFKSKKPLISTHTPAKKSGRPSSVEASVWTKLNDPALGQVEGTLAKTGDHGACVNGWGLFDMVGNVHEWVAADPKLPHGTFAGGYYLDTSQNGDGCKYRTTAHAHDYHDYSTGFRCCADAAALTAK